MSKTKNSSRKVLRLNRIAVVIAVCCWCWSPPSSRKAAAARPMVPVEPVKRDEHHQRQRRDLVGDYRHQMQQGLESLHLSSNKAIKLVCDPPSSETLLRILGPAFNARYMAIDEPPEEKPSKGWPFSAKGSSVHDDDDADAVGIETDGSYMTGRGRVIAQRGLKGLDFAVEPSHEQVLPDEGLFSLEVEVSRNGTHPLISSRRKRQTSELWRSLRKNHYERFTPLRFRNRGKASTSFSSSRSGSVRPSLGGSAPTPPWHCPSKVVWQNLGPSYFPQFVRTIQCGRTDDNHHTPTSCWFGAYQCAPSSFTMKILHRQTDFCYPVIENNRTVRYEQKWSFVERAVPFCCSCQFKLFSAGASQQSSSLRTPFVG